MGSCATQMIGFIGDQDTHINWSTAAYIEDVGTRYRGSVGAPAGLVFIAFFEARNDVGDDSDGYSRAGCRVNVILIPDSQCPKKSGLTLSM